MFKIIIIMLFCFFLQSCSSSINTTYSLNNLKYGMSKNNVINNVFKSKPTEKKIIDKDKEIYVYYIHSSLFELFINKERFPYIGFYPFNRTGREYWLLFDNKDGLIRSAYAKEWSILGKNTITLQTTQ